MNQSEQTIPTPAGTNEQKLAEHIIAEAAKQQVKAEVKINPIPPHIAANILVFMQRVQVTGMEAIAWAEAYSFMQQFVPQQQPQQGVPFGGLPVKQA